MKNDQYPPFVLALNDASAILEQVGGKGASLARMAAAGLPVPPGFYITTAAYRRFVMENELQVSHAAIVAGELGIPAVVGCGNATMRLHTGDWPRVNGGQGTIEVLQAADAAT